MEGTAFSIEEAGFDASWPRSARSCSNAGSMRLGDKAKARQALEAAIELEPQNSFALRSLGSLLVLPGAFAAGVARFRQALAVAPGDLITTYNLAQALLEHDPEEHRDEADRLLLPEGQMLCNHPARHLIRILRQRVEKAKEEWMPAQADAAQEGEAAKASHLRRPEREQTENYAAVPRFALLGCRFHSEWSQHAVSGGKPGRS